MGKTRGSTGAPSVLIWPCWNALLQCYTLFFTFVAKIWAKYNHTQELCVPAGCLRPELQLFSVQSSSLSLSVSVKVSAPSVETMWSLSSLCRFQVVLRLPKLKITLAHRLLAYFF